MGIKACLGCTKRHMGCHSTCQEYKDERAELDEQSAAIRKQKREHYDMIELDKETRKRLARRRDGK